MIEGLRAYVARADDLLTTVRRTAHDRVTHPMPPLPARLSADEATPAEGVFTGWAAFRLDERRVRDLLMGIQLYKDRDLAIRELYQNALDACRYRRARTQYLDRTRDDASYAYEGEIEFEQDAEDGGEGRAYVECRDNGVGMGESELRGVFCRAGSRFVDQVDFKLEREEWAQARPPVELHPNSRFGIGVLSYFMLADEMRVTTCRMGVNGELGPLLEVTVFGPGHLFRIVRLKERGEEAGTRVRLYLRGGEEHDPGWSCLNALERVLGIAEFPTSVTHGPRRTRWKAGQLRSRKAPGNEPFGLDASGRTVPWQESPEGTQVIWCEYGGGLLVDGLVVHPEARPGVLSSSRSGLTGAVVNLFGASTPQRLSADRRTVLDDVSGQVKDLIERAAVPLVAGASSTAVLPSYEWICRVAEESMVLGDLLTAAAVESGRMLRFGGRQLVVSRTGCFLADARILGVQARPRDPWSSPRGHPPDSVYLWRLMAHGGSQILAELVEACPEIAEARHVLPAMPSDRDLLAAPGDDSTELFWDWSRDARYTADHLLGLARRWGTPVESLVDRAKRIGGMPRDASAKFDEFMEMVGWTDGDADSVAAEWRRCGMDVPESYVRLSAAAREDRLLQRELGRRKGRLGWVDPDKEVPAGHIVGAGWILGLPVAEVCARLSAYGLRTDAEGLPDLPDFRVVRLLSEKLDGRWPWLSRSEEVPPGHVLAAARGLGERPRDVLGMLADLGFAPPSTFPDDADPDDLAYLRTKTWRSFRRHEPIPYTHFFDVARRQGCTLREAIDRMRAYGFDVPFRPRRLLVPGSEFLYRDDGPLEWAGVTTADAMPFAHFIAAARSLFTSPSALADRLRVYGLESSCRDIPEGLTFASALELLRINEDEDLFLTIDCEVDLYDLIQKSRQMNAPIAQVVGWLQELGIPVPDLSQTLREALSRVPMADRP